MFDLVVEKAVAEIEHVIAVGIVGRTNNLAHVKTGGLWLDGIVKSIEVFAGVIRDNGNERVNIRQELCSNQIDNGVAKEGGTDSWNRQQWQRQQQQPGRKERPQHLGKELFGTADLAECIARLSRRQHGQNGGTEIRIKVSGQCTSFLFPFGNLQLFERVGGVVEPLPNGQDGHDVDILERGGSGRVPNEPQISLDQVRVRDFVEAVVVEAVVFDIPSFWGHPVEPVQSALANRAQRKAPAIESSGFDAIVASVARVVRDHGPTGERPRRECRNGERIGRRPHRRQTNNGRRVSPSDNLVEVCHVLGATQFLQFLSQRTHVLAKGVVVELGDPLVVSRQAATDTALLFLLDIEITCNGNCDGLLNCQRSRRILWSRPAGATWLLGLRVGGAKAGRRREDE